MRSGDGVYPDNIGEPGYMTTSAVTDTGRVGSAPLAGLCFCGAQADTGGNVNHALNCPWNALRVFDAHSECDRCGQPESAHSGIEKFCPFYSTFRRKQP